MRVRSFLSAVGLIAYLHCSIVEFASPEDAQRAVRELSEVPLLGRPVFIREVRCPNGAVTELTNNLGSRKRVAIRCHSRPGKNRHGDGWTRASRTAAPTPSSSQLFQHPSESREPTLYWQCQSNFLRF